MGRSTQVKIEDLQFPTIMEAAKFLNVSSSALNHALRKNNGKANVQGMLVERTSDLQFKKRFQLFCKNTGETFVSIPQMLHNFGVNCGTGTPVYVRLARELAETKKCKLGCYEFELLNAPKYEENGRNKSEFDTMFADAVEPNQINVQYSLDEEEQDNQGTVEVVTPANDTKVSGIDAVKKITLSLLDEGEYAAAKDMLAVLTRNQDALAKISC